MGRGLLFIVGVFLALFAILVFAKSRPASAELYPTFEMHLDERG